MKRIASQKQTKYFFRFAFLILRFCWSLFIICFCLSINSFAFFFFWLNLIDKLEWFGIRFRFVNQHKWCQKIRRRSIWLYNMEVSFTQQIRSAFASFEKQTNDWSKILKDPSVCNRKYQLQWFRFRSAIKFSNCLVNKWIYKKNFIFVKPLFLNKFIIDNSHRAVDGDVHSRRRFDIPIWMWAILNWKLNMTTLGLRDFPSLRILIHQPFEVMNFGFLLLCFFLCPNSSLASILTIKFSFS